MGEKNIKMVIEYDGTNYAGFQRQSKHPTIQAELEIVLTTILREKIKVTGSGRTDAGVHALYQVINFKTTKDCNLNRLQYSLNSLLPDDISVKKTEEVNLSFHARRSTVWREYKYFVLNKSYPSPFFKKYAHLVTSELDIEKMKEAAHFLIGTHDFSSFTVLASRPENPERTIYEFTCERKDFPVERLVVFKIRANAFLHNMVRVMLGTLLKVGSGNLAPEEVKRILETRDRTQAGPTVAAKGLFLTYVSYE